MNTREQGIAKTILAMQEPDRLRAQNERLLDTLQKIAEFCSGDVGFFGAVERLAQIQTMAFSALLAEDHAEGNP